MTEKYCSFILNHLVFMTIAQFINTSDGSMTKVLSVTHSSDKGDVFEILANESVCVKSCERFGGFLQKNDRRDSGSSHKCSCYCANLTKPTFYRTKIGQESCVKDIEVLADTSEDLRYFYTDNAVKLQVLNLHNEGKARIKPDGSCENLQVSDEWKYYYNGSWISSSFDTFSANTVRRNGAGKNILQTFLTWNGNLTPFYKGLLIKVIVRCTYGGKTDNRFVMLKAEGTHFYHEVPTYTTPVTPSSQPVIGPASPVLMFDDNPFNKTKPGSVTVSVRYTSLPTDDYSKGSSREIWVITCLGLSALLLIIGSVIAGFIVVKCRRNCRKPERSVSRRPLRVSSEHVQHTSETNAAMHDYEYVHYPCLVDRGSTLSMDKRRCERSEGNKLVIWSEHSSGNATQTNQSTQVTPPRLPYQRLLTRVTSTPPPEGNVSAPVTSPTVGLGEEFPYQKLIKTVPSTESSGQQGSENGEKPEADVSLYDETCQKPYQSLSLKRNPKSCPMETETGYMLMEGAPPPERIYEYDYTEPLEPYTLSRISHGDTEQVIVQVSIGDLNDVTLNEHQLQQQQRQPFDQVITFLANTAENYEDIENMNIKNGLPTEGNDVGHGASEYKSQSAESYENLSGENKGHLSGRRTDPEEYVEMGKRRSVLVSDYADQSSCNGFPNIDEEGPEYHVLEGIETSEYKKFDDGDEEDDDENDDDDADDE